MSWESFQSQFYNKFPEKEVMGKSKLKYSFKGETKFKTFLENCFYKKNSQYLAFADIPVSLQYWYTYSALN